MAKQVISQQGAQRGDIGAYTLRLGTVVLKVDNIAAVLMAQETFCPNDTPMCRRLRGVLPLLGIFSALIFIAGGVALMLIFTETLSAEYRSIAQGVCIAGVGLSVVVKILESVLAWHMKRPEPFFRLVIEMAGGRRFSVVDDNPKNVMQLRDLLYHKLESHDPTFKAVFDMEKNIVSVSQ